MSSPSPSPSPLTTIFIVPFRDRHIHKQMFLNKMAELLSDWPSNSYEIYFAHQCDARPFNRGAMKNIGFLAMKQKYPALYSSLTFIFHDVDYYPSDDVSYYTTSDTPLYPVRNLIFLNQELKNIIIVGMSK